MAITPSDFSKIWASNADTPEYTFNEADYLKGWDFVGNLPPTRAQWNAIQKSTDEKMKYVFDNFGAPLTASTVAGMTMQNRVYVYTGSETGYTAGHWYYWNGSAWTDGGVYNSNTVQVDPTLTISGAAADAKMTGEKIEKLGNGFCEYYPIWETGGIANDGTNNDTQTTYHRTDFIPVEVLAGAPIVIDNNFSIYIYQYKSNTFSSFYTYKQISGGGGIYNPPTAVEIKYIRLVLTPNTWGKVRYYTPTTAYDLGKTNSNAITELEKQVNSGKIPYEPVWEDGSINGTTGQDEESTTFVRTGFIDVHLLDGCSINYIGTYANYYYEYESDNVNSFIFPYQTLQNGGKTTINPRVGCKYIRLSIGKTRVDTTNFERNSDAVITLRQQVELPNIIMPSKFVALVDEEFDIHYDNVISNYDARLLPYKEAFGPAPYGMKNMLRMKSSSAGTKQNNSICFSLEVPSAITALSLPISVVKKSFDFHVIPKTSGSDLTRNVLLIGDSWTANGYYPQELRNLFDASDEPMDIHLLGTLGMGGAEVGPTNGFHEGHGGYSSRTFCTQQVYNGYNNYFYNPTTEKFDFSYYMSYCEYSDVDDVFINLGINDVAAMEDFDEIIGYYNQMITSIRTYKATAKIFIGLCGLPAEYEMSDVNENGQRSKSRRLLFHQRLMDEYGNRENEGLIIVPLGISIDNEHDFRTRLAPRSFRDSTLVEYLIDNVHPGQIAYNKIADRIRTYIKYAETI